MRLRRSRLGFTLVELLVVIAIIGVLIALLLPAVQQAREAAQRTQCKNNLHNIGLAVHNYLSTHKFFPTALFNPDPFGDPGTWMTLILPFMDQNQIYDNMNFSTTSGGPLCPATGTIRFNTTAISAQIAAYACPTDSTNVPQLYANQFTTQKQQPTNYAGCMYADRFYTPVVQDAGMFSYWSDLETWVTTPPSATTIAHRPEALTRKVRDVSDGTSQSIYALEVRARVPGPFADGEPSVTEANGYQWTPTFVSWFVNIPVYYIAYNDCNFGDNVSPWWTGPITCPRFGINLSLPPQVNGEILSVWPTYISGGSFHQGGCHALYGDGSVQFITENISLAVFKARTSIGRGETITEGGAL